MSSPQGPVVAAGAICWRTRRGVVEVLLIHRGRDKDVSFPKGKVDPGESVLQTAVREIDEETGYRVHLGAPIGTAEYVLPSGRDKIVHYWVAEVTGKELDRAGDFTPNTEVAAIEWVPVADAARMLTYARDVELLEQFAERVSAGRHDTFALIALRHAKTVPGSDWNGPDATRPLLPVGRAQAKRVAPSIAAYGPRKIVSSTAARCLATVEPLSTTTKVGVSSTADISQDAHEHGRSDVKAVVRKRLAKGRTAVLCSHGPVLPDIIARIASDTTDDPGRFGLRRAAMLATGDFAVLHIAGEQLVAVETHSSGVHE
ncbi:NUDIX hydrolase [Curtobacterium sp. RRHDQ10]|uniref:NUDIX hydrolase n=1 Tax=Curtobacterium phyllosphaerae TaxID=3413379 RepID=UPI003BF179AA